jgi:hypothetical protein
VTEDTGGTVIPFPVVSPIPEPDDDIPVEDPPDLEDYDFEFEDATPVGCPSCGTVTDEHEDDCVLEVSVDEVVEAGGRWLWVPVEESVPDDPFVGLSAYRHQTMCRWTFRHHLEGLPIPQPCCYTVEVRTSRLEGPVRQERSWLAPGGPGDPA